MGDLDTIIRSNSMPKNNNSMGKFKYDIYNNIYDNICNNICNNILERSLIPFLINFYISKNDKPEITIENPSRSLMNLVNMLFDKSTGSIGNNKSKLLDILTDTVHNNSIIINKKRNLDKKPNKLKLDNDKKQNIKHNIKSKERGNLNNESRLKKFLRDLTKSSFSYSRIFYDTHNKLYMFNIINYKNSHNIINNLNNYLISSINNYWNEYFSFNPSQEINFKFKRKKGGDYIRNLVAYSQVTSLDYDEEMEIQRISRLASLGIKNYVDPEAMERHKLWSLFRFNQVLSWYYFDNVI
jgi:hypothetical protein